MSSLVLSILLFVFWTVVGMGVLSLARRRAGALRSWLLAPSIGLSIQILAVCVLNQAGLPVNAFARPLALGLLVVGGALLAWRRPVFPRRALLPFCLGGLAFLVWAGWPALRLGFHWISYVNDDFTNYCLSAERFRSFAFFRMPTLPELIGRDYTQYFWFMHVLALMRFGAEHALAFVGALVGLNALYIFMPVILALGLAQIFSIGALVLHRGRWRRQAQWAAVLLGLSPVFIFGSLYQLIAQVGGLALMLTAVALLTARFPSGRRRGLILCHAIPTAIVAAALALFYPEITPFAVLAVVSFAGLEWWRERRLPGARIVLLNFTLVGLFVLLRYNLVDYIYTLAHQANAGVGAGDLSVTLFPFYLIPSGFAVLFGFQALPETIPDPFGSFIILLGGFLFALIAIWAIRRSLGRLRPVAVLLAVQVLMAVYLFGHGNDFGLYKLAMFIQPALWAGLADILASGRALRWKQAAAIGLVLLGARTTWYYTSGSTGMTHSGMTEMDHASEYLRRLPPAPPHDALWISNIDNIVALKVIANLYRGTDLRFLSRDFFNSSTFGADSDWPLVHFFSDPSMFHRGRELLQERDKIMLAFDQLWGARFDVVNDGGTPTDYVTLPHDLSLFNKLDGMPDTAGRFMEVAPARGQENLLAFIHSSRGNHYYLGDRRLISFTQLEEDPYAAGGRISSVGRFLLFRIEHPTPTVFLRIAASKTNMAPGHKIWSANAVAEGATDLPLDFRGGGAANKFVGPLVPVWRKGTAYVAIDFCEFPAPFPIHRTGLAAAYHRWVPLDYRRMVAFARDISALSPEQRNRLVRPRRIASFPADIATATALEFSGIYEDGWVSPEADFGLGGAETGQCVRIKGMVPEISGQSGDETMRITINGNQTWTFPAGPGRFDWLLPIEKPGLQTDVALHFSSRSVLPNGDERPVGAKLELLEVGGEKHTPSGGAMEWPESGQPRLPSEGIDTDGWADRAVILWLPTAPQAASITLTLDYPGWPELPAANDLAISVDGAPSQAYRLKAGSNKLEIPIPAGSSVRKVKIVAAQDFKLPGADGRVRAFRLVSVSGR